MWTVNRFPFKVILSIFWSSGDIGPAGPWGPIAPESPFTPGMPCNPCIPWGYGRFVLVLHRKFYTCNGCKVRGGIVLSVSDRESLESSIRWLTVTDNM